MENFLLPSNVACQYFPVVPVVGYGGCRCEGPLVLPLNPGAGQNIVTYASHAARNFILALISTFLVKLPSFFSSPDLNFSEHSFPRGPLE